MKKTVFILLVFLSVVGCMKQHLYVQLEKIGPDFLASTHVNTRDYRKKNPPLGQRIIVCWDFPENLYQQNLKLKVTVRFWNNTQEDRLFCIKKRWGLKTFFFSNPEQEKEKNILTYKLTIINDKDEIIEIWKHQFWTKLIDVDKD